ncbi:MAG: hypothetical protein K1X95_14430 [Acidimicrobiia bacterium]|nr:hypothetical protein [Acidimicrobiia bacterium]
MDVDDHVELGSDTHTRREALRKAAAIGATVGAASITGISIVPGVAQAASSASGMPQITANGTATKTPGLKCFSGAGGDDQFEVSLGDGWWHFYFQGCAFSNSESVILADPPGGPSDNAYQPPTGYQCRMLVTGTSGTYDTGWVADPINGIADTGGVVFIGPGGTFWGLGNVTWQITCDPI